MRVPLDEFVTDQRAKNIRKKPYLAIVGLLLTLGFGFAGLYVGLYSVLHEDKPDIYFEIVSEANVIDVYKPLRDLRVLFQEEDIQQRNLNLRILTVKIENKGEVDILQSHFDQNITWGFRITEGEIIDEVRLVNSNSEYLKSSLKPKVIDKITVGLEKTMLERGKYFTLEFLVLHEKEKLPEVVPIGKIAGIETEEIIPIKSWLRKQEIGSFDKFIGNRFFSYFGFSVCMVIAAIFVVIAAIFVMIIIAVFGSPYENIKKRRLKKHLKKEIARVLQIDLSDSQNKLLLNVGGLHTNKTWLENLRRIRDLLEDKDEVLKGIRLHKSMTERELKDLRAKSYILSESIPPFMQIEYLAELGILIHEENNEYSIEPQFKQNLDRLIDYLEAKNR